MKVRDVEKKLKEHGFRLKRQVGSHRRIEGFVGGKRRLVTLAGKKGDDVAKDTLRSIRDQSSLPRSVLYRK